MDDVSPLDVVTWSSEHWPLWFPSEGRATLRPAILSGRGLHQDRATVFLFAGDERAPRVVLKVGFTEAETQHLRAEHEAMGSVRRALSADLQSTIPEPLGLAALPERTVLAMRVLQGRHVLVPHLAGDSTMLARTQLRRLFGRLFAWSRRLAEATEGEAGGDEHALAALVERFLHSQSLSNPVAASVQSFGESVARSTIRWHRHWQHRDPSVGNVVVHRRQVRLIDWEYASPDSPPWLDVSYTPVATLLLARRQGSSGDAAGLAERVLDDRHWVGSILRTKMTQEWFHPLPIPWAVTLTAMGVALRQQLTGRPGGGAWGKFAVASLTDRGFRKAVGWLAPNW